MVFFLIFYIKFIPWVVPKISDELLIHGTQSTLWLHDPYCNWTKSLKNQPCDVIKVSDYPSLFWGGFLSHFSSYLLHGSFLRHFVQLPFTRTNNIDSLFIWMHFSNSFLLCLLDTVVFSITDIHKIVRIYWYVH